MRRSPAATAPWGITEYDLRGGAAEISDDTQTTEYGEYDDEILSEKYIKMTYRSLKE